MSEFQIYFTPDDFRTRRSLEDKHWALQGKLEMLAKIANTKVAVVVNRVEKVLHEAQEKLKIWESVVGTLQAENEDLKAKLKSLTTEGQ